MKDKIKIYIWALPVIIYLATIKNPELSFTALIVGCVIAFAVTTILGE
jgi:hypothetical protein